LAGACPDILTDELEGEDFTITPLIIPPAAGRWTALTVDASIL
jgi:hypothetical protein